MPAANNNNSKTNQEDSKFRKQLEAGRKSMTSRFRFLVLSQITMTVFLYYQVYHPSIETAGAFDEPPPEIIVVLSRWICALFLHISMRDEADIGFKIMKFSINHPWKFDNWWSAFCVGLLQYIIIIMVEFVSMMVLLLQ